MLKDIITLLNSKLLTTGYFQSENIYALSELKKFSDETRPMLYCSNGEYKKVDNFDLDGSLCYWRLNSNISFESAENNNLRANDKMVRVRIPLRLVAVVRRDSMTEDTSFNAEILGRSLFAVLLENLNGSVRRTIGANMVSMDLNEMDIKSQSIMGVEFAGNKITDLKTSFVNVALNLTVNVDIKQSCINTECDIVEPCQALLNSLTELQKNTCILPAYDFSDTNVTDNLTAQQIIDLTNFINS